VRHEHSVEGNALPAVHVRVERRGRLLIPALVAMRTAGL
jgi:hypothetical protein